jgi:exopolysaccharide biosynthesis polyprenyl glycosylphosphotransferase
MVTKAQDVHAIRREGSESAGTAFGNWIVTGQWLKQKTLKRAMFAAGDTVALVLSHMLAVVAVQHSMHVPRVVLTPRDYWFFYLPFLLIVFYVLDRSCSPDLRRPEKEVELVVKGVSLAFVLLVCANFVVFKTGFSRYLMFTWYALAIIAMLVGRYGLRLAYGWLWRRGIGRTKTLLVGSPEKLFELQTLLSIQRYEGYELLGLVPAGNESSSGFGGTLRVLGSLEEWHQVSRHVGAEQVILALGESTPEAHGLVSNVLKRCLAEGIDLQVYSDVFASRQFNYELDEFSGFFRFFAAPGWSMQVQLAAKRALDFAAGVIGSLITLMILPVVALLIKVEDGGSIFFRSKYIDRDGEVATCLKFRTMCENAEQMLLDDPKLRAKFEEKYKLVDDPRVLRVGRLLRKYSIDELPQFFGVLLGRLSLVGPRIIAANQISRYGDSLTKLLSVKPGLTGFWQVMGRQSTSYDVKVRMDMFYIDHWSIWLDLWIITKTFLTVLFAEGAY